MPELEKKRIVVVGPLPPPPGGMANQTAQLARFWERDGADVHVVRTNRPYQPAFVEKLRFVRSGFRWLPYVRELRREANEASLFHIFANSGWSWHLFAAPALRAAHAAAVPVVLNYRGGDAERFFERSFARVEKTLRLADVVVVPSPFLESVFARYGVATTVVPNIIDLERFHAGECERAEDGPVILVTRNLEPIYDVATGMRAAALLRRELPSLRLDIAGTGPEEAALKRLAQELSLEPAVRFLGRVDNEEIAPLYHRADIALNTSLVDNMPVSILEAFACGTPVVSTSVGGVPALVSEDVDAVLTPPQDPGAVAAAIAALWRDAAKRDAMRKAGLEKARSFGWPAVRRRWLAVYDEVLARS